LAFGNFVIRKKVLSGILMFGEKEFEIFVIREKSIRDFCYSGKRVRESVPIPVLLPDNDFE